MNDEKNKADEEFEKAQNQWNQLKEFVTNPQEVQEYLLTRIQLEQRFAKDNDFEFNAQYKKRFAEFVGESYDLLQYKMKHSEAKKFNFQMPQESETLEEIVQSVNFKNTIDKRWLPLQENKEKYIKTINELLQGFKTSTKWEKDVYISELTAKRYIGDEDDGETHHIQKKITEFHYKTYGTYSVSIQVERNHPCGPFLVAARIFKNGALERDGVRVEQKAEQGIDEFVENQKQYFDANYATETD